MRPTTRLEKSSKAFSSLNSAFRYICPQCRRGHLSQLTPREQRRFNSKQDIPLSEKVRRKIWGTDNPPGLPDPYGGPSFLEKLQAKRQGRTLPEPGQVVSQQGIDPDIEGETVQPKAEEFVPATTWDGLEFFGGDRTWADLPPSEADEYYSFLNWGLQGKLESREEFLAAIHQAIVEITAYTEAGHSARNACETGLQSDAELDVIRGTKIIFSPETNSIKLQYPENYDASAIVHGIDQEVDVSTKETNATEEESVSQDPDAYEETTDATPEESADRRTQFATYPTPTDESFLSFSLSDLETRFVLTKRIAFLTGRLIPDPTITSLTTLSSLLDFLLADTRPQNPKVAEILSSKPDLISLPNVTVKDRRQTWVDKEKNRGLLKIIEREIEERGLPGIGERGFTLKTGAPKGEIPALKK